MKPSKNVVFQLSAVSQNDPGCPVGDQLQATLKSYRGGNLGKFSSPQTVRLPIPPPPHQKGPPTPTWFLELTQPLEDAEFVLEITGPPPFNAPPITIHGADMPNWVAHNKNQKTNQIYKKGDCGIFGFAQSSQAEETLNWIYTITAAVNHPKIHPPE